LRAKGKLGKQTGAGHVWASTDPHDPFLRLARRGHENLPLTLRPGMGGVIIGPRDGGLNRAADITFGLIGAGLK